MLKLVNALSCSLMLLSIIACGSNYSSNRSPLPGDEGSKTNSVKPLSYSIDLDTMLTGDSLKESSFKLPVQVKEGQKVTISFKFNSKASSKLKVIQNRLTSTCTAGAPDFMYQLVRLGEKSEVVYEDINLVSSYEIEPNTDYAYEALGSPSKCSVVQTSVTVWLGASQAEPVVARACSYDSASLGGVSFYYFLRHALPKAFISNDQQLLGNKLLCGKQVEASEQKITKTRATGSVKAEFKSEDGTTHSYSLLFSEDKISGELSCFRNGLEFDAAVLSSCEDIVLDERDFE